MFAAGSFLFPTSTGSFSVTTGTRPQLLVMFGSNRAEEDTLVTGLTNPGLFLSVNGVDYLNPSTVNSFCVSIAGSSSVGGGSVGFVRAVQPIRMQGSSAAVIDYAADDVTLDAGGFTLNVTNAASGDRPIHWWVLNHPQDLAVSLYGQTLTGTFDVGFRPFSYLALDAPGSGSLGISANDSWLNFGTAHYPLTATDPDERYSGESHTGIILASAAGRQGYTEKYVWAGTSGNRVCHAITVLGPGIFSTYKTVTPTSLGATTIDIGGPTAADPDEAIVGAWAGEGYSNFLTTPTGIGDTVSVSTPSWFDLFQLVMFSTNNGANVQLGSDQLRYGLGVLHQDYQGCVVFGDDGSFYQSRSQMAATCTAGGAQAAEGVILGPTFESTTVLGGSVGGVWHGFGPLGEAGWVPQMYRWWPERRGL